MNSHLVAVKVGIIGVTDQGMKLDGLSLNQYRFKGLDAEPVQRGSAVQRNWMFGYDLLQNSPTSFFSYSTIFLADLYLDIIHSTRLFIMKG
jgi:hypothetical protein